MNIKIVIATLLVFALSACAPDIIKSNNYNFSTTLGQELIDLKKALDEGAINSNDYESMIESLKEARFAGK